MDEKCIRIALRLGLEPRIDKENGKLISFLLITSFELFFWNGSRNKKIQKYVLFNLVNMFL